MVGDIVDTLEYIERKTKEKTEDKTYKKVIKYIQDNKEKHMHIIEMKKELDVKIDVLRDILIYLENREIIRNIPFARSEKFANFRVLEKDYIMEIDV